MSFPKGQVHVAEANTIVKSSAALMRSRRRPLLGIGRWRGGMFDHANLLRSGGPR